MSAEPTTLTAGTFRCFCRPIDLNPNVIEAALKGLIGASRCVEVALVQRQTVEWHAVHW